MTSKPTAMLMGFAMLLNAGCASDLRVTRYAGAPDAQGYPYHLRFSQFELAVTWRVVSCDETASPPVGMKITADIKEKPALDPNQFYLIDPRSLQGLFRATTFTMDWYDDRGLKSINSTVDDQTGTAAVSALTALSKIAGVGLLSGGGGGGAVCKPAVVEALGALNGPQGPERKTNRAQEAVEAQTLRVADLIARGTASGALVDEASRARLAQAQTRLAALTVVLGDEKAKLKALLDVLTDTRTFSWPLDGDTFATQEEEARKPTAGAIARWGVSPRDQEMNVHFGLVSLSATNRGQPPQRTAPAPDAGEDEESQSDNVLRGLPYREPTTMRLRVCTLTVCPTGPETLDATDHIIKAADYEVLQEGNLLFLPFQSRRFANITSTAGFSQTGRLTSAGTNQVRPAGVGLTDALSNGAVQVTAAIQADRTAETARLTAATAEVTARQALAAAEAQAAPSVDAQATAARQAAIAAYQAEATLATAERSMLEARALLAAVRANPLQ